MTVNIKLNGKTDKFVLISQEDYELVSKYKWYLSKTGYAQTDIDGKTKQMHRFIMGEPENKIVDHKNRNRLDDRRENLRIYTKLQNGQNITTSETKTGTIYRGVFYDIKKKSYNVRFTYKKKYIHIGSFQTEIAAIEAFDMYIVHNKIEEIEFSREKRRIFISRI